MERVQLTTHGRARGAAVGDYRSAGLVVACVAAGVVIGMFAGSRPVLGLAVALTCALVAIPRSTIAVALAYTSLVGLVLLSRGFNNIPFDIGVARGPLVDVALAAAVVLSAPLWLAMRTDRDLRRVLVPAMAFTLVVLCRIAADMGDYGNLAIRDGLVAFEAWSFFVGIVLATRIGVAKTIGRLNGLFAVAAIWFLLYPFADRIKAASPKVGIDQSVALLDFTVGVNIAAMLAIWFVAVRRPGRSLFLVAALSSVLLLQSRGGYLVLVIVAVWAMVVRLPRRGASISGAASLARASVGVAIIAAVIVVTGANVQGRLGARISASGVAEQMGTLAGNEGMGAGSFRHRKQAWSALARRVASDRTDTLVGVGLGPDLFGGFTTGGELVRKPHNDFLEVWARTGIVGLVAFVALLGAVAWPSLRVAHWHPLGTWFVGLHAYAFVMAMGQPFFAFAYNTGVYFMLAGIATVLARHPEACQPGAMVERGGVREVVQIRA